MFNLWSCHNLDYSKLVDRLWFSHHLLTMENQCSDRNNIFLPFNFRSKQRLQSQIYQLLTQAGAKWNDRKGIFYQVTCWKKIAPFQVCQKVSHSWPLIGHWCHMQASDWSDYLPSGSPAGVTRKCRLWLVQFQWQWPNGDSGGELFHLLLTFIPSQPPLTFYFPPTWQFREKVSATDFSISAFAARRMFCKFW